MILYISKWYFNMISFRKKSPRIYNRKWQPDWLMFYDVLFKMISINIKQAAGIVMTDLQQLWPAHRNDALKNIVCYICTPAAWFRLFDVQSITLFIWHQLNIKQSAKNSPVKALSSLLYPSLRYDLWPPFRYDGAKVGYVCPLLSPFRVAIPLYMPLICKW